jgi:prophage DNA circulation protein
MSWRDRYTPGGKFRDAAFWVETDDLEFGRRVVVHEFPLQDKPVTEDMGRRKREFSINAFVVGPDYDFARNRLIDAIEQPGPGVLVHPYLGTMNVTILNAHKRESTSEGGMARFQLTCIEGGEITFAFEQPDTPEVVEVEAEQTIAESILEFGENFDVLTQAQEFVDDVQQSIEDALDAVESVVTGITDPITSLIRAPAEMASSIAGTLGNLRNALGSPLRALDIYKTLFNTSTDTSSVPQTTSNRLQQLQNIDAADALIQRVAIAEACKTVAIINWPTKDDAIAIRDVILNAIDDQMDASMTDGVYNGMSALRAALAEDVRIRSARLPRLAYVTPATTLPALVLAHHIHNDARRDAEIVGRNAIPHPGFVAGGQPLEYIKNV